MITNNFIKLKILWCRHHLLNITPLRFLYNQRKISKNVVSQNNNTENYDMTTNTFNEEKIYKAVVRDIFNASATIKILRLSLRDTDFTFKAGQWVDFYVSGISEVAGYSITSPPHKVKEEGIMDLAVKYAKFPPTHWIHTSCCEGEEVQIRVGGDFCYDPQPGSLEADADLLLVGGGVGINPMVSILCEYSHFLHSQPQEETSQKSRKVCLLYSAKTVDELVFKDLFTEMEKEHLEVTCKYFITRNSEKSTKSGYKYSRIQEDDVLSSIKQLQIDKSLCYICGPSTMTDDVARWLKKFGIQEKFINYEKWW